MCTTSKATPPRWTVARVKVSRGLHDQKEEIMNKIMKFNGVLLSLGRVDEGTRKYRASRYGKFFGKAEGPNLIVWYAPFISIMKVK